MFAPRMPGRFRSAFGSVWACAAVVLSVCRGLFASFGARVLVPAAHHAFPLSPLRALIRGIKRRLNDPQSRWHQLDFIHHSTPPSRVEFAIEQLKPEEDFRSAKIIREIVPKVGKQLLRVRPRHEKPSD